MRILALATNLLLLVILTSLFVTKGVPSPGEWPLVALLFATPLLSTIVLWRAKETGAPGYLGLWLHRKRLEEQAKINALDQARRS